MAKTFTPQDCHALMNELVLQATGQKSIAVVDTNSFVSAGELVLSTGVENTLNSLSIIVGKLLVATRPYEAKLRILNAMNTDLYTSRLRKVSFYARDNKASGDWNTDLFTNLKTGFTNGKNADSEGTAQSTPSMWEQNQAIVLEKNFGGQDVWQTSTTIYEYQLKVAFRNESEFGAFMSGIMTEKASDIESTKEAFNRMALINHMGMIYNNNNTGCVVNLTKAYNDRYGTNYSSSELRTTYLQSFLGFFVSTFKITSDYMTNRSAMYHRTYTKTIGDDTYNVLRHTPKSKQKALLYSPLFTEAEAQVFPEIFNDRYLKLDNYEGVTYWQNIESPTAIDVKPSSINSEGLQVEGAEVSLPYVVGCLFDEDALMIDYQFEGSNTSPLEARKAFRNIWWSFSRNVIADDSENFVLFIMTDEE